MRVHISRILIIDDDPSLLAGLAEMLNLRLCRVEIDTCSDPGSAVQMVQIGDYDLILCDCWMPRINGLQLLPRLREASPATPIVMMTGALNDTIRQVALSSGATSILAKPFDRQLVTITRSRR